MTKLIKALSNDKMLRYYVVDTTKVIAEIKKRHNPSFGALMALGKVATFATLYGPSILSNGERATIKIDGNGSIGTIYCDVNNQGNVKIMATNMYCDIEFNDKKPDFSKIIGTNGTMSIIKDMGMGQNYNAMSPILQGDISETFSYFMQISEQKPSAIGIGLNFDQELNVVSTGGFMAQLLPGATENNFNNLEKNVKMLPNINDLFKNYSLTEILEYLSHNDYKIIEELSVNFVCDCTKQRFLQKLLVLKKEDLADIFTQNSEIEVVCEFCKNKYTITKEDVYGKN